MKQKEKHNTIGLDPRVWRGLEAVMREINSTPGVQAWWRSNSRLFGGEEFAKFINQQQQTAKPPRLMSKIATNREIS